MTNSGAGSQQLPKVPAAVKQNTGADPQQVVADADYQAEAVFEALREYPGELIVAIGRETKLELRSDLKKLPLSVRAGHGHDGH